MKWLSNMKWLSKITKKNKQRSSKVILEKSLIFYNFDSKNIASCKQIHSNQVQFITNSRWPLPQKNLLTKFLRSVINRFLEKDLKRRKFEENLRIQGENNTEVTFETSIIDENKKLLEIFKSNKSI